jgi:hypothetical protein
MRLAALSGIDAAEVDYVHKGTRGTVLVKRFDRHVSDDGTSCEPTLPRLQP